MNERVPGVAEVITPAPRATWQRCADQDSEALATQSAAWSDAATAAGPLTDASRLYRFDDGTEAVLPLLERRVAGRPVALWSMPMNWGFGGLVGAPTTTERAAAVLQDLRGTGALSASVRPLPTVGSTWDVAAATATVARHAHVLDLAPGIDAVWSKGFTSKTRNHVRRAERNELDVECDATGRLGADFDRLLACSVQRWAGRQGEPLRLARARAARRDPPGRWAHIARGLDGRCRFWAARRDGVVVAVIIVLLGPSALYVRGAMDRDGVGNSGANDLLQWLAIRDAAEHGCRRYHLGETAPGSSLAHFKERLGAAPVSYTEARTERLPITAADRRLRSAVKKVVGFRDD